MLLVYSGHCRGTKSNWSYRGEEMTCKHQDCFTCPYEKRRVPIPDKHRDLIARSTECAAVRVGMYHAVLYGVPPE